MEKSLELRPQYSGWASAGPFAHAATVISQDEHLINTALGGDNRAYERLFNRYRKRIYSICLQYSSGDQAQACDLSQEVFISAFSRLGQLKDKPLFLPWLTRIAKNKCISYIRKQRTLAKALEDYEIVTDVIMDDEAQWTDEEVELVSALMKNIDNPEMKKTIELFYIEGKSTVEIAEVLGFSQTAVTSRLNRFRGTLKARLVRYTPEDHSPS